MNRESKPVYLFKKDINIEETLKGFLISEIEFLLRIAPFVVQDRDIENLHDFRVVIRRTRGILKLFKKYIDKEKFTEVQELLKDIFDITGSVRDYDIFLNYVFDYKQRLPEMENELNLLESYISKKRVQEFSQLKSFLESDLFKYKIFHLLDIINTCEFFSKKNETTNKALKNVLIKSMTKLEYLFENDLKNADDSFIHEIRIELKKIRYLFDIFKSIFKKESLKNNLSSLKNIQDLLGKNQDLVFQLNFIKNYEILSKRNLKLIFEFIFKQKQENMLEFNNRYKELKNILPVKKYGRLHKMKIIALYSPKGGVGKSVTAVNLSYLLSVDGKKILLWDVDPQGASSFYLQVRQELSKEIEDVLTQKKSLKRSIAKTNYKNLFVLPSDFSLRNMDIIIDDMKKPTKKLKQTISDIENYDFLIIDSPPGFTNINKLICKISDIILVPIIPTYLSLRTLDMLKHFLDDSKVGSKKIFPFFSMADRRKKLHRQTIDEKIGNFKIKTVVPYSAEIEKMGETLSPLPVFSKNRRLIEIYKNLKKEVVENVK